MKEVRVADWIGNALLETLAVVLLFGVIRLAVTRHAKYTHEDSNAPHGKKTDWKGFWGRR